MGNQTYKLFNYFPTGKTGDLGLALHCYWQSTHTFQKRIPPLDLILPQDRLISYPEYENGARKFNTNKIHFHDSGMISIKNSQGDSLNKNVKSIAFGDIPEFVKLCHSYLPSTSDYPQVDWSEGKTYNLLKAVHEASSVKPLRVELHLCHPEYSDCLEMQLEDEWGQFGAFRDKNTLERCGLYVYTIFIESKNPVPNPGPVTYIPANELVKTSS